MTTEFLIQKGKLWVPIGLIAVVAYGAWQVRGIYSEVRDQGKSMDARLVSVENAVKAGSESVASLANEMRDMGWKVSDALEDRWSGADMKYLWSEFRLAWSELGRLNPTLQMSVLPEARRITERESRDQ